MALQQWLGLLSERRTRPDLDHYHCARAHGPALTLQSFSERGAVGASRSSETESAAFVSPVQIDALPLASTLVLVSRPFNVCTSRICDAIEMLRRALRDGT